MRPLLLALFLPSLAFAAQTACPPLGTLPNYKPDPATLRTYQPLEFTRRTGNQDETEDVTLAGPSCQITYRLRDGADALSNLEVQANYRQQLAALGAQLQYEGGRDTFAKLVRDGAETWFRIYGGEDSYELTVLRVEPPKLTLLPPSGPDHKLLGHMPGFTPGKPTIRNYDSMTFTVLQDGEEKEIAAQGRAFTLEYQDKGGRDPLTNAEINANYRTALKALGAEILYAGGRDTTARLLHDNQVVWLRVYASETSITVYALEEKPFEPSIKPPPPIPATIATSGRVTLYVNFDFDRATLRPDAAPVVAAVVAALKADPKLRLAIEGHTDALGAADHNRKLSADRAAAFAAALAAGGIPPDRLTSAGFGPDKPAASNDTSEGRAKNRRVELVRM